MSWREIAILILWLHLITVLFFFGAKNKRLAVYDIPREYVFPFPEFDQVFTQVFIEDLGVEFDDFKDELKRFTFVSKYRTPVDIEVFSEYLFFNEELNAAFSGEPGNDEFFLIDSTFGLTERKAERRIRFTQPVPKNTINNAQGFSLSVSCI